MTTWLDRLESAFASNAARLWLLALFVTISLFNNIMLPPFEASDEAAHFAYADFLAREQRLPDLRQDLPSHEVFQPVAYYALVAPVISLFDRSGLSELSRLNPDWFDPLVNPDYWQVKRLHLNQTFDWWPPWRPVVAAVHAARAVSTGLGVLTLLCIWQITLRIAQHAGFDPNRFAMFTTALVAFNPKFMHMASTVTNDVAVTLAATAACAWMLHMQARHPRARDWFVLGGLIGLAILCKIQAIGLLLPAALLLSGSAVKRVQPPRVAPVSRILLSCAAGFLLSIGWWLLLNQLKYGDPLAWQQTQMANAALQRAQPLSFLEMLERVPRLFVSYWGVIGIEKALSPRVDGLMFGVLALAMGGCIRWATRVVNREGSLRAALHALLASPYAILFAWQAALTLLFLMWMRTHVGTENSRLLLPGAVSISVLVARGLWSWLPPYVLQHASLWRIKAFAFEDLPRLAVAGMCVLSASTPLVTLFPAFTTPWPMDARTERLLAPNLIDLRMNGQIRLLNAWLGAPRVIPGQALPVSMMWSRLTLSEPITVSYRIALEAVDQRGEVVARRRFIPWDGRYPTTQWRPGEVFRDDHLLPIDGNAERGVATIWLSLVDPAKPGVALKMGDAFRLRIGEVRIDGPVPALAQPQTPLQARFGDALALRGVSLGSGETPELAMHFTGVRNGFERSPDLTYFVHVLDANGKLLWQQDQPPRVNTRWWDEGDDIIERLPIKRPAAATRILLGWYAPGGERLPALRDGVLQQDGLLTLWSTP